jgi:uncharacterized paraquat-inducible protein A
MSSSQQYRRYRGLWMANQVMENLHRHLYRFMIIDLLLVILILSGVLASVPYYILTILLLPVFAAISFKNKRKNGDKLGMMLLFILSITFLLVGLQDLAGDSNAQMIQGILLVMLSVSTFRRIRTIRDPIYKNWYGNLEQKNIQSQSQLEEGEVLATCPSCLTLLAVIPGKLSEDDKCPHCDGKLVN